MISQKKNRFTLFWFSAGFIAVALFMFFFYKDVHSKLTQTEIENIRLTANQQQATIDGIISSHIDNLKSMSHTILVLGRNDANIGEYLRNIEKSLSIQKVVYANNEGRGLMANNSHVYIDDNEAFQGAIRGEITSTSPYTSKFSGERVIAVGVPMIQDGDIVGAVVVEYGMDYIQSVLVELVDKADEKGYTIIVNKNGEYLTSTSYENEYLTPFSAAKFGDGISYDDVVEDIAKRKQTGGGAIAYIDNEELIVEYRPIRLRDWSIVVISEDVSNTLINNISEGIYNLLLIITVFFFIFLACILYLRRKGVRDIEAVAFYDELTGLPNLVNFREQAKNMLKAYPDMQFTMQKMDIKNFKVINEMFGHDIGNLVLKKIAETLKAIEEPTFICARVGADQFLMFSGNNFLNQGEQARDAYEQYFRSLIPELDGHEFVFRYGRYFIEKDEMDIMEIINKTNMAHHITKIHSDKKTYEYDDKFKKRILRLAEINNKRKSAIENRELKVFLQPKMNIFENKLCGAEALVRWVESDGKMIFPDEFIPLFEKNGFIVHLDNYILKNVCRQIKIWLQAGYNIVPISVNFSRMHLQNPNFVEELKVTCDSYGQIRQYVEVELTESAATENADELERVLKELHEAGFSVAIDDFGAGYSSLGMLKNFTVDAIKLDKSFFDENSDDSRGDIVVSGIINMAKSLGMKIVAEGIETAEQVEFLKSVNSEIVQGYYFAKPMPLAEFEQSYMGVFNDNKK